MAAAGNSQEFAGEREAGLAGGAGEQAVMADAMEAARQDMEQESADELVDRERHDLLPVRAVAAVVLVAEGDAALVEGAQAAVRDRRVRRSAKEACEPPDIADVVALRFLAEPAHGHVVNQPLAQWTDRCIENRMGHGQAPC